MRTAAFVLFAVVTAAAAALSTLVASRYLNLEKELVESRSHLESVQAERKRQEEDKQVLRLERERVQADADARLAEMKAQLDECAALRQNALNDITASLANLNKRLTDVMVSASPSAHKEAPAEPQAAPGATDVPHGAIPSPEQEARRLNAAP